MVKQLFLALFLLVAVRPVCAKPVVQASNYPLAYFAQRIAGERIDVQFLPPPDGDPAFWEPSDADIGKLQSADRILLNGATYEKWLAHVSLPDSLLWDTSEAFAPRFFTIKDTTTHSHGKEGAHSHAGTAFTTWIDFSQARLQAESVLLGLVRLLPDARKDLEARAATLTTDLDELDREMLSLARAIGDQPLVASHPVYHYLARRYGLKIESVLWEPETVPDEAALQTLRGVLTKHPAKWMIWEGTPAPESVAKLRTLGLGSLVFAPCGNRPETGDWLTVMRQNLGNLRAIPGPR
ncbi:MAG: zinc ABC transporter substrate-binding protein [Verrucomicrobia bacterium]|nr:zinc ABC transporter substrate-binding protein [Verrucomicrobiota bacterium]